MFAQIDQAGSRLTDLARGVGISPQAMGELVDEVIELGYVVRRPDPRDCRAKLIVLTEKGEARIEAGRITVEGVENEINQRLGQRGHVQLRKLLERLLDAR